MALCRAIYVTRGAPDRRRPHKGLSAMAIPERQLAAWANVGALKAATATYDSVRVAIDRATSLKEYEYRVYLQGSYRNATNIFGDMDVDIVVEATDFFYKDIADLTDAQKAEFERRFPGTSEHSFSGFRSALEAVLTEYYGSSLVTLRNKCILVEGKSGRLDADVVPCVSYRDYRKSSLLSLPEPKQGITFFTRDTGRQIINYPLQHYDNGIEKNKATAERFKPAVRIFKNLRNHCVSQNLIAAELASSYFVTCLIYNVPTAAFKAGRYDTTHAILQWMHDLTEDGWDQLVCENGLFYLCRDAPDLWNPVNAKAFRDAAITAWNNWGS